MNNKSKEELRKYKKDKFLALKSIIDDLYNEDTSDGKILDYVLDKAYDKIRVFSGWVDYQNYGTDYDLGEIERRVETIQRNQDQMMRQLVRFMSLVENFIVLYSAKHG